MYFGISKIAALSSQRSQIEPPLPGITIVVGPNNVGKSQLLRELADITSRGFSPNRYYSFEVCAGPSTRAEFDAWFDSASSPVDSVPATDGTMTRRMGDLNGFNVLLTHEAAFQYWQMLSDTFAGEQISQAMTAQLLRVLNASTRLQALNSIGPRNFGSAASHPLHSLVDDEELELQLSAAIESNFGVPISVNRLSQSLSLLIGAPVRGLTIPPEPAVLSDLASRRPVGADTVGDGVQSFIATLLHAVAGPHRLLIIDEPELFLHPPQARRLGRALSEMIRPDVQLFAATHSADFLEGVVSSSSSTLPICLVRLSIQDGQRTLQTLPPEVVRTLWTDPVYKSANALNSFFYPATIICEGESDARFYGAALDGFVPNSNLNDNIHWIELGGKARIARMVTTLRDFGLPTGAIVDFDLLKSASDTRQLLESVGYPRIDDAIEVVTRMNLELAGRGTTSTVGALKARVNPILKRNDASALSDTERQDLRDLAKADPGWQLAKKIGAAALEDNSDIRGLLRDLRAYGLFIVPVGELERWIDGNGPKKGWVTRALEQNLHLTPSGPLSDFLEDISRWVTQAL